MISGSRLYGKTLEVKGVFYVATQCFHLNFVPLFPFESYIMMATPDPDSGRPLDGQVTRVGLALSWESSQGNGIPIGRHWGSFGMAWLRIGFILAFVFSILCFAEGCMESHPLLPKAASVAMAFFFPVAWLGTYYAPKLGRASHADAIAFLDACLKKGKLDGFHHQVLKLRVDAAHGRVSSAEAEAKMAMLVMVRQAAIDFGTKVLQGKQEEEERERQKQAHEKAAGRAAAAADPSHDKWAQWREL